MASRSRVFILAQQEELVALREDNEQLCAQLTALATELASLRERIGRSFRSFRNSSKQPSSDGQSFKQPERRKGSGRMLGGEPGHEIGAELLGLQQQLFGQWHQWKDGTIDWQILRRCCRPIRQFFEATLQRVVDLGCQRDEQAPWAKTVRTCDQLLQRSDGLWTFM